MISHTSFVLKEGPAGVGELPLPHNKRAAFSQVKYFSVAMADASTYQAPTRRRGVGRRAPCVLPCLQPDHSSPLLRASTPLNTSGSARTTRCALAIDEYQYTAQ